MSGNSQFSPAVPGNIYRQGEVWEKEDSSQQGGKKMPKCIQRGRKEEGREMIVIHKGLENK